MTMANCQSPSNLRERASIGSGKKTNPIKSKEVLELEAVLADLQDSPKKKSIEKEVPFSDVKHNETYEKIKCSEAQVKKKIVNVNLDDSEIADLLDSSSDDNGGRDESAYKGYCSSDSKSSQDSKAMKYKIKRLKKVADLDEEDVLIVSSGKNGKSSKKKDRSLSGKSDKVNGTSHSGSNVRRSLVKQLDQTYSITNGGENSPLRLKLKRKAVDVLEDEPRNNKERKTGSETFSSPTEAARSLRCRLDIKLPKWRMDEDENCNGAWSPKRSPNVHVASLKMKSVNNVESPNKFKVNGNKAPAQDVLKLKNDPQSKLNKLISTIEELDALYELKENLEDTSTDSPLRRSSSRCIQKDKSVGSAEKTVLRSPLKNGSLKMPLKGIASLTELKEALEEDAGIDSSPRKSSSRGVEKDKDVDSAERTVLRSPLKNGSLKMPAKGIASLKELKETLEEDDRIDSSPRKSSSRCVQKNKDVDSAENTALRSPLKNGSLKMPVKDISFLNELKETLEDSTVDSSPRKSSSRCVQKNKNVDSAENTALHSPLKKCSPKIPVKEISSLKREGVSRDSIISQPSSPSVGRRRISNIPSEVKDKVTTTPRLSRKSCKKEDVHKSDKMINDDAKKKTSVSSTNEKLPVKSNRNLIEATTNSVKCSSTEIEDARIQLMVSAVPKSLPCRTKEFNNIYSFLTRKIEDKAGGCMYISGVPGTGKTATVHAVVRKLQEEAKGKDLPSFNFVEINGLRLTEPRQAYTRILQTLTGQRVPPEQAQRALDRRFSGKEKKSTVLLVDELDYLCNRRQDVVYNILDWPMREGSGLVILTIANTMDLPERTLKGKVTSRMGLTRLMFQPYTHHQLQEIVLNRLAGNKSFHPDAVQLVARKVAAVSGDARRALDICRRATELVSSSKTVTIQHVEQAVSQIFTGPRIQAIRGCSMMAQLVLRALRDETLRTGVDESNFARTYMHLVSVCALEGVERPTCGEVQGICTTLEKLGLVIAEKGRPDLTRKLSLNVSSDDIHYALNC